MIGHLIARAEAMKLARDDWDTHGVVLWRYSQFGHDWRYLRHRVTGQSRFEVDHLPLTAGEYLAARSRAARKEKIA